jgi:hypothetical protein
MDPLIVLFESSERLGARVALDSSFLIHSKQHMEQDAENFSELENFGVGKERKGALRLLYKFQQMAKDTRISPGHSTYAVIVFF